MSTAVCGIILAYAREESRSITVKFDSKVVKVNNDGTVTIGKETYDKSKLTNDLKRQLEIANREIQKLNPKVNAFVSINVTKDCCASVTCGGGAAPIKCCITGPGSCESGTFSVACIAPNHEEHDACGEP
jgi:hypothetical protein